LLRFDEVMRRMELRSAEILRRTEPSSSDEELDARLIPVHAHRALAREAATRAIVLLRNESETLPLSRGLRRVALVGPLAGVRTIGDRGSSDVNPLYVAPPLAGPRMAMPDTAVDHYDGADPAVAAALARDTDAAIVVVGYTHRDEGEYIPSDQGALAHLFS